MRATKNRPTGGFSSCAIAVAVRHWEDRARRVGVFAINFRRGGLSIEKFA